MAMNAKTYDAVIIGGGVNGCATAYYLAKKGLKPLVIEKNDIGGAASGANGGGVRQSARDPRELPVAQKAVSLWETLSDELEYDVEYHQAGNLRLCTSEEQLASMGESVQRQADEFGLDVRMVDRREALEINPHIADKVLGASWCATDGHANPMRATYAYMRKARQLGAEVVTGEGVVDCIRSKGRLQGVVTEKNRYEAPVVVNAAGIHGRKLANKLGLDFPMSPVFTEVLVTEACEPLFPQMFGTATSDFYGHQTQHGSFVWGGFAGFETFLHNERHKPNYSMIGSAICRAVLGFFPVLERLHVIRVWSGLIAQVSDKVPVLGTVEGLEGYVSATGFSGHGFGIAPAVGTLMAELIADGAPSMPLDDFRHGRFAPKN